MTLRTLFLSLVILTLGLTCAHAAGLVKNSEFVVRAADDEDWPADWSAPAAVKALYSAANDDGCSDKDSLRYRLFDQKEGGGISQGVVLRKNTDYVLTAALKSDGKLKPVVRLNGPDGQLAMVVSDGSKTWKVFSVPFNSGAADRGEVQIFGDAGLAAHGPLETGTSGIDGVQVFAANEVPAELKPAAAFVPPGPNIALHKPYTLSPAPGYGLTVDAGDRVQLTDGEYSVGYFWAQKTTVGWSNANPVIITIDLGQVEPISGMSYNTAAGVAGVSWPGSILILTSDDGKSWTQAGDLINLATRKVGPPPTSPYSVRRFTTDELKTHGRFVKLFVDQTPYNFVDEIEIYRGPQALLTADLGPAVDDPIRMFENRLIYGSVMWRLRADLDFARKAISESVLPAAQKEALHARAAKLAEEIETVPSELPADFKAILPLNDVHAKIYALYAPLHRAKGLAPLTVWANSRWDMLAPTQAPARPEALPQLSVYTMQREYRGVTFNLTNTTDNPVNVTLNVEGLPGGSNPDYVSVREVPFTDTRDRTPIACALPDATKGAAGYRLSIPSGVTRQVWLDFRPLDVKPGSYKGRVLLRSAGAGGQQSLPLALRISPLTFPDLPSIHIGGWDYLQTERGTYDAGPDNTSQFLKILPANYIDTPWATAYVQPSGGKFDPEGQLTNELSFANWDRWIALWPGARLYAVFLSVPDEFGGEKMGTPRFNKMVGDWITAWAEHMKTQGLEPSQLVLLLWDEPNEGDLSKVQTIKLWARAINAAQPDVKLFEDPTFRKPQDIKDGFWEDVDILCPNLPMFLAGDDAFRSFYADQQKAGREMWFYSCSGPSKLLDPINYHRSQFWHAIRYGYKGSFYWAFGDEAGGSSWNAYLQKRAQYSPLFIAPDSVTDAKHMAAIREGAQDFEYFVMLRTRVSELEKKGVKSPVLAQAQQLLESGPRLVCDQIRHDNLSWDVPKDRDVMDRVRTQALELLDKLASL